MNIHNDKRILKEFLSALPRVAWFPTGKTFVHTPGLVCILLLQIWLLGLFPKQRFDCWGCSLSRASVDFDSPKQSGVLKTQFSPTTVFPSMDVFLVEDSAVDWFVTLLPRHFLQWIAIPRLYLSPWHSRAVIDIPIEVASRVVVTLPSAVASRFICFLSTVAFLLEDSVSQWFDTRYFTFSPAKSSVELFTFSLSERLLFSAEQDLFSYSMVDWVDIPVFSSIFLQHLSAERLLWQYCLLNLLQSPVWSVDSSVIQRLY